MNDLANNRMSASNSHRIDFDTPVLQRKRRIRALKDRMARWYVSIGGLAVLGCITLIFFYLAYVVAPMFGGADLEAREPQQPAWLAEQGEALLLSVEEQNKVAMRLSRSGQVQFFGLKDGVAMNAYQLALPAGASIVSVVEDQPGSHRIALGLSNGQVLVFKHVYKVTYPNNVKTITPQLEYPFGEAPITLDPQGRPLEHVAISENGDSLMLSGSVGAELQLLNISREENMMTGEVTLDETRIDLPQIAEPIKAMIIDPRQQWLFVINGKATADVFDLRSKSLNGRYTLLQGDAEVSAVNPLLAGISLMIGDSQGGIGQWFMVRDADGKSVLTHIRSFQLGDAPITQIIPEERRKGFVALDSEGRLGLFHSTAHRTLLTEQVVEGGAIGALSPRANRLLLESKAGLQRFYIDNPHPEISWSAPGARSGTRATTSPSTSGSRPRPTATSSPR